MFVAGTGRLMRIVWKLRGRRFGWVGIRWNAHPATGVRRYIGLPFVFVTWGKPRSATSSTDAEVDDA